MIFLSDISIIFEDFMTAISEKLSEITDVRQLFPSLEKWCHFATRSLINSTTKWKHLISLRFLARKHEISIKFRTWKYRISLTFPGRKYGISTSLLMCGNIIFPCVRNVWKYHISQIRKCHFLRVSKHGKYHNFHITR